MVNHTERITTLEHQIEAQVTSVEEKFAEIRAEQLASKDEMIRRFEAQAKEFDARGKESEAFKHQILELLQNLSVNQSEKSKASSSNVENDDDALNGPSSHARHRSEGGILYTPVQNTMHASHMSFQTFGTYGASYSQEMYSAGRAGAGMVYTYTHGPNHQFNGGFL